MVDRDISGPFMWNLSGCCFRTAVLESCIGNSWMLSRRVTYSEM